ncbi:putative transcription factor C2H2 family [Rosa chinensis]|uniref:RBR-type E3 ubiquitin transferase n=1 Tax=Rosa chinensis TaxID=74649 RepID=A0A2P6RL13_ROSCH|nr:E3 ubiquitin-protein ligase RNF144A [Rosa chinensis]PRQ47103.1 putative transcription factor C2H2 family [Rosa chinensis]
MEGEASNSKKDPVCEICVEDKSANELFGIQNCCHSYCTVCVVNYVVSKLQENITGISCPVPDCRGSLEPEHCQSILPSEVFDRWLCALCEALVLESEKFYCPFKDCSAMLIDDGKEVVRESECPNCRRLFCAQCKVSWHAGFDCAEFQNLNKDERENEDILLRNLADKKKWRRCTNCQYYVEKSDGCSYMKCRCGYAFCYNCGVTAPLASHTAQCPSCKQ